MANGRVGTGLSGLVTAIYSNDGTNITYTGTKMLARAVSINVEPDDAGTDNVFRADNRDAETQADTFAGGEITVTVDGLLDEIEQQVFGLPAPEDVTIGDQTVKVTKYGDSMNIPYVGVGFVRRFMSDGETTYVPFILLKTRFNQPTIGAETGEEETNWQTQELSGRVMRSDDAQRNWKFKGEAQATEAEALQIVWTLLGGTGAPQDNTQQA